MLYKLLRDLQAALCVVTATHLRGEDLYWVRTSDYYHVTKYCRAIPPGIRPGGGALILAHRHVSAKELPQISTIKRISSIVRAFPAPQPVRKPEINTLKLERLQLLSAPK